MSKTTDRAVETLRELIFTGALAPGSDHLETELADRLGMSRTPVREAAVALEAQGLVSLRPRKGLRVLPISVKDMAEIYDILTELEGLAVSRAARIRPGAAGLTLLSAHIDRMDDSLARNDLHSWAEADEAFHAELVRLGQNTRLEIIVSMLVDQVRRARRVTLHLRPRPEESNRDHRAVMEAISRGDAERACALHRAHRERSGAMLLDILETHGLTQI